MNAGNRNLTNYVNKMGDDSIESCRAEIRDRGMEGFLSIY